MGIYSRVSEGKPTARHDFASRSRCRALLKSICPVETACVPLLPCIITIAVSSRLRCVCVFSPHIRRTVGKQPSLYVGEERTTEQRATTYRPTGPLLLSLCLKWSWNCLLLDENLTMYPRRTRATTSSDLSASHVKRTCSAINARIAGGNAMDG